MLRESEQGERIHIKREILANKTDKLKEREREEEWKERWRERD